MTLGPIDEEGIREMQERYAALDPSDKKIVEEEEDKLLSTLIYNFTAYMVMMEVIIVCNRGFISTGFNTCKCCYSLTFTMHFLFKHFKVPKNEITRKVRRLMGKCHVTILYCEEINALLDELDLLVCI